MDFPGHDFRRLLGLWVYALSFRREALSVLDVAFVVAEYFPPRRRCAIEGAVLDVYFPCPLLDADFRAQPHLHLHATDASLRAPVLARHLCLMSFGPFFTTLRRRKVVR